MDTKNNILVDSRAPISATCSSNSVCTPTSQVSTIVGVSGTLLVEPLSEQTGSDFQHAMLISERSVASLSGKDLLRRQHASIHCTPAGLFLTVPDNKAFQAVQYLKSVIDF